MEKFGYLLLGLRQKGDQSKSRGTVFIEAFTVNYYGRNYFRITIGNKCSSSLIFIGKAGPVRGSTQVGSGLGYK